MSDVRSKLPLLNIPELDQFVVDYVSDENFESKNYSPQTVGPSFFENRLPLITLLNHVVRGEYEKADAMLTKNPMLLLGNDTVTDYSGRVHYRRTAYQLALGGKDTDVFNKKGKIFDGMVEMIEKHFQRLPLPIEEINRHMKEQYEGQFPKDFADKEAKRIEMDKAALYKVWDVIAKASDKDCDDFRHKDWQIQSIIWDKGEVLVKEVYLIEQSLLKASEEAFEHEFDKLKKVLKKYGIINNTSNLDLLKAIYAFRNHLEPKGPVTSGLHYNYELSKEAYRLFKRDDTDFKSYVRRDYVLGYIVRFLPACDAQVGTQSQNNWEMNEKLPRSFYFRKDEMCSRASSYYPLSKMYTWDLGHGDIPLDRLFLLIKDMTPTHSVAELILSTPQSARP